MNRRALLATVGGTLAALAGCAGIADDRPTRTSVDRNDNRPTPELEGCPAFVTGNRADCAANDPSVALTPSSRVYEEHDANGTIEVLHLILENRSSTVFEFDPGAWQLYRRDNAGGPWARTSRGSGGSSSVRLDPGGSYGYELVTTSQPTPGASDRTPLVVDLDSGEMYAVLVAGTLAPGEDPTTVECVARFRYVRSTP